MDELKQKMPTFETLQNNVPSIQDIKDVTGNAVNTVQQGVENIKNTVNETMESSSLQSISGASSEFLNSNSIISKFVFVIFAVVLFFIFGYLGIKIVFYLTQPSRQPYIVKGVLSGNSNVVIPQGTITNNNTVIYRSNNKTSGLELTWSVWLNVSALPPISNSIGGNPTYAHIFNKGNNQFDTVTGLANVNNAIGLYLTTDTTGTMGSLYVFMDTPSYNIMTPNNTTNSITVSNFPMQKWVHVAVRVQNTVMDVYVNGTISGRTVLPEVPKQNYDNINIGQNGGFSGNMSDLRYFDYALSVFNINNIILMGPSLYPSQLSGSSASSDASYLSSNWYMAHL